MNDASTNVQLPDAEIIVRAADFDVAAVAFFRDPDVPGAFEVLTAISSGAEVSVVAKILQDAAQALRESRWEPVDAGDPVRSSGTEEAPKD